MTDNEPESSSQRNEPGASSLEKSIRELLERNGRYGVWVPDNVPGDAVTEVHFVLGDATTEAPQSLLADYPNEAGWSIDYAKIEIERRLEMCKSTNERIRVLKKLIVEFGSDSLSMAKQLDELELIELELHLRRLLNIEERLVRPMHSRTAKTIDETEKALVKVLLNCTDDTPTVRYAWSRRSDGHSSVHDLWQAMATECDGLSSGATAIRGRLIGWEKKGVGRFPSTSERDLEAWISVAITLAKEKVS